MHSSVPDSAQRLKLKYRERRGAAMKIAPLSEISESEQTVTEVHSARTVP